MPGRGPADPDASPDEHVQIGAVIDMVDAQALEPGLLGALRFCSDEAAVYVTSGATFRVWYGRVVGEGVVERIVGEVVDATS